MRKEETVFLLMVSSALSLLAACGGGEPNREGCFVDFADIEDEVVCEPSAISTPQGIDIAIISQNTGLQVQAHLPELPHSGEEVPTIVTVNGREGCLHPQVEDGVVILYYHGSSPQNVDVEALGIVRCDDGQTDLYVLATGVEVVYSP